MKVWSNLCPTGSPTERTYDIHIPSRRRGAVCSGVLDGLMDVIRGSCDTVGGGKGS